MIDIDINTGDVNDNSNVDDNLDDVDDDMIMICFKFTQKFELEI